MKSNDKLSITNLVGDDIMSQFDKNLLRMNTANNWLNEAKNTPIPKMLFSEFWYEGEVCILFADTNLGKSILAVQIANSISKGEPIDGFKLEVHKQSVLYFDFELSYKQFELRYSIPNKDYCKDHYKFDDDFKRVEINPRAEIPENKKFEDYLNEEIERCVKESRSKVLIIDNITYLSSETEKAKDALPLMRILIGLKRNHSLSLLVLAHTPKRDQTKPLNKNDLQGSKTLINLTDSCFAIGESQQDDSLRYLKQIKERNTSKVYDSDNVLICKIEKLDNFLGFHYLNADAEYKHLKLVSDDEKEDKENKILALKESNPNISLRDIAEKVGTNHMKVKRILEKHGKL